MENTIRKLSLCLTPFFLLFCNSLSADSTNLDNAIKKYYAGYPNQAINMIKPQAMSGDANAQYLLGNILYGLSNSSRFSGIEDPIKWYKLAADQDFPAANYALGVIYNNLWEETSQQKDAMRARSFFQKAADLGYEKALGPLSGLTAQSKSPGKSTSLTYTNSSFSSKQKIPEKPENGTKTQAAKRALAGFKRSENPVVDLLKLQELFKQLSSDNNSNGDNQLTGSFPDMAIISSLLSKFESTDKLVADLVKLLAEIKSASNYDQLSGAN